MPDIAGPGLVICGCGFAGFLGLAMLILALAFRRTVETRTRSASMLRAGSIAGIVAMIAVLWLAFVALYASISVGDVLILAALAIMAYLAGFGVGAMIGFITASIGQL